MSIALDPIHFNDITTHTDGPSFPVNLQLQPERVGAVKVFNNSPYLLQINNAPGVQQVWLAPWTEEVYLSSQDASSASNKVNRGQFTIQPRNQQYRGVDMDFTTVQSFPFQHSVSITVYEITDQLPLAIPIVHPQTIVVSGEVQPQSMTLFGNATFTSGAGGSVNINAQDAVSQDSFSTVQYYSVLAGISIDVTNNSTQHNFTVTISGCLAAGGQIVIGPNIPVGSYSWFRAPLNWRSELIGAASNIITVSVGAISSGPTYTITIWGYPLRLP